METTGPSLFKLTAWVVFLHVILICWLSFSVARQVVTTTKAKCVAKTVKLEPKKATVARPKPKQKPVAKPKKKTPPKIEKDLLAKAQESIAKIGKKGDKSRVAPSKVALPKALSMEPEPEVVQVEQGDYREELISRLKLLLRLPEFGAVKLELTISRQGVVQNIAIVSTESQINRAYVEKTLPEMKFPGFGDHFGTASKTTFSITLENET
jgi:hypothetical protein